MGIFLKEQHAVNGLFGTERENHHFHVIYSSCYRKLGNVQSALQGKCVHPPPNPNPNPNPNPPVPTVGPISDTALDWAQISRATARPSEPECSHTSMSAVTVMRKLTWHFSNPVHCGLPFQLSSTVIEHHIINSKKSCAKPHLKSAGGMLVSNTTAIKLKSSQT